MRTGKVRPSVEADQARCADFSEAEHDVLVARDGVGGRFAPNAVEGIADDCHLEPSSRGEEVRTFPAVASRQLRTAASTRQIFDAVIEGTRAPAGTPCSRLHTHRVGLRLERRLHQSFEQGHLGFFVVGMLAHRPRISLTGPSGAKLHLRARRLTPARGRHRGRLQASTGLRPPAPGDRLGRLCPAGLAAPPGRGGRGRGPAAHLQLRVGVLLGRPVRYRRLSRLLRALRPCRGREGGQARARLGHGRQCLQRCRTRFR